VSVRPGGIPEAVRDGFAQHLPLRRTTGAGARPLLAVDAPAIVVESVKLAEDRSGDLVVRLSESLGGRAAGRITTAFGWELVEATDLLERRIASEALGDAAPGESVTVRLRPFELLTLRFRLPR
jgi:alpha-mannosidase